MRVVDTNHGMVFGDCSIPIRATSGRWPGHRFNQESPTKSIHLVAASLLSVTLVACSNPSSPVAPLGAGMSSVSSDQTSLQGGRAAQPTIVGIATGNPAFSTLAAAVVRAGLVDMLDGDRHWTVFAPTNAAFDALAKALGASDGLALVNNVDLQTLTAILSYHVTRGDRNATSVVSAGKLRMLDGNLATISMKNGAAYIQNAKILTTDIRASNGIVHVIDAVILPPGI